MMGHKISTYHDVQMKGVEFLRNIHAASGISVKPRSQVNRIEMLKEVIRAWGLNPEKILAKDALTEPARIYLTPYERERHQLQALTAPLKEAIREELLPDGHKTDKMETNGF